MRYEVHSGRGPDHGVSSTQYAVLWNRGSDGHNSSFLRDSTVPFIVLSTFESDIYFNHQASIMLYSLHL